ncbi:hypothetical protein UR09_01350 [Candidatus Nitromaritima sp. SCGC AAA799-A02]|nr:hypothetical protein UR09_01350 [Candidatus Nitromaritima sp. SCGC AAA799-A02]
MHRPYFRCFQGTFSGGFLLPGVLLAVWLTVGTGCSELEVVRAFEGEFPSAKNNKVISEYCASCHIHKEFDFKEHVAQIRPEYRRRLFRKARECRVCHYLEKQWAHNNVLRKTRRPQEANRGSFKDFEKKHRKSSGKS